MLNLGLYSGKDCPDVRFRPRLLDRVLEGIALLVVLATWACIGWLYLRRGGDLASEVWLTGGSALVGCLLVGGCAYLPVRFINFPVRVGRRNVGIQYLLVVRFVRVLNIVLSLLFLCGVFVPYYPLAELLFNLCVTLLLLCFVPYFIFAWRYRA